MSTLREDPTDEEERDHAIAQHEAVTALGLSISSANADASHAVQVLAGLQGGREFAVDYSMSTVGADIYAHLQDAMRSLRAAHALHRSVAGEYPHPDVEAAGR